MEAMPDSAESGTRYVLSEGLRQAFADEGYLKSGGVISRAKLAQLSQRLGDEFEQQRREGRLFSGGGTVSGHLNCFPGAESRFVDNLLQRAGIIEIAQGLSTTALCAPNIGCNLNLPGSAPQNEHVDGDASQPFLVLNVAAVDTNLDNGAMEILRRTHRSEGRITFLPNRYRTDLKSRIREHAFVALPALGTAYRAVRSFF